MGDKTQYFNGYKFTRDDNSGYYMCAKLKKRMHTYVWEFYNGPISTGYEVHHIDFDKSNNDISNLQLLKSSEHKKLHSDLLTMEQRNWRRENLAKNARPKASEWHKSEEGRKWHSEHAKKQMQHMKFIKNTCIVCGKEFESKQKPSKFCSGACKAKHLRKSRKNQTEERICSVCGTSFIISRFSKRCTCSATCRTIYGWRTKNESKISKEHKETASCV